MLFLFRLKVFEMNIPNVYEYINNTSYDPHAIRSNMFILGPHQVIPKFYLLSNPEVFKLVVSYSMGAGKSATAVYTLLYNLSIYRMYNFNKQFASNNSKFFQSHVVNKNVIVIGVWQTKSQFEVELMKPEFSIIEKWKIQQIEKLLASDLRDKVQATEQEKEKIIDTESKQDMKKDVQIVLKKSLTDREQLVFEYLLNNIGKTVFAKDLAQLLDLPRDYVYKYIKNLRAKIDGDKLKNVPSGGFVLTE
jgi:hypothetical protein